MGRKKVNSHQFVLQLHVWYEFESFFLWGEPMVLPRFVNAPAGPEFFEQCFFVLSSLSHFRPSPCLIDLRLFLTVTIKKYLKTFSCDYVLINSQIAIFHPHTDAETRLIHLIPIT